MKLPSKKSSQSRILIEGLPENSNYRLVAWWYCGIKKNPTAPSEPKVEVCFRPILKDGGYGSYLYFDVGLTSLGQVRLGTIWHHQRKVGQIPMEEETFQLDFSDDGWRISGPWDKSTDPKESGWLVSQEYRLPEKDRHPKTRVVQFHLSGNPRGLVIPCLELYSRLYGRSQYIKRILVTQPFDEAFDSLIVPDVEDAPAGAWQVTVDMHCVNGDGTFLAHLKHDGTTKRRVRKIWGQMEAIQEVFGSAHAFPGIGPWFKGTAQLQVKGIWLDQEKRRFLALQINGCSDPGGVAVYLDRANTNVTGVLEKIKDGTSWALVRKVESTGGADIQITHIQEPSAAYATEEIEDDVLKILGEPRKVIRVQRESTSVRERARLKEIPPNTKVSGGAVFGGPKGVSPVSIVAPEIAAIDDAMIATWKTLQGMVENEKFSVLEVASVTSNGDLVFTNPVIIGFPDPEAKDSGLSDSAKSWVYLDHKAKISVRGVMLLQITTKRGRGYIMEVQRRPARTFDNKAQSSGAFQYLAFTIDADSISFKDRIAKIVLETANALGVVSKVSDYSLGSFVPFNHINDDHGGIRRSMLNGLRGIGLI